MQRQCVFAEESAQTSVHPVPPYKDPTYTWNEWDLRRDAMRRARLRDGTCVHGVAQTGESSLRHERGTHAQQPGRVAGTQTAVGAGTDPMGKKSLVVGLKSKEGSKVEHVLLEDLLSNI